MPKQYSEAVNPGRTDNTMAKEKRTKGQRITFKAQYRKP